MANVAPAQVLSKMPNGSRRTHAAWAPNVLERDPDRREADWLAATVADCRQGNRDAQRRLYESCRERVYGLAVRMVGHQDAPDVTQNVFLQLFRKINQFAGHARFDTWLYRLAINEALQYLRKRSRWKLQAILQEPVSHGSGEDEQSETREMLELALSRLEPELRSIFLLREAEGRTYRDIAEAVGAPEGTVGSRLNRARRELQKHLTRLGWEPRHELR